MSKPHNPPMYTKHWFRYLSEAGRPVERVADELDRIAERIVSLRQQIADLGLDYKELESTMMPLIKDSWNEGDIELAKSKATV